VTQEEFSSGSDWPAPDAGTYTAVVVELLALAVTTKSNKAKRQFTLLAALYESLARRAASMAKLPPLPIVQLEEILLPDEPSSVGDPPAAEG
jgi:hypothetical protein